MAKPVTQTRATRTASVDLRCGQASKLTRVVTSRRVMQLPTMSLSMAHLIPQALGEFVRGTGRDRPRLWLGWPRTPVSGVRARGWPQRQPRTGTPRLGFVLPQVVPRYDAR